MTGWQKQEGGRVEEAQRGGFVVRGILLDQESVLGAVSFGLPKEFRLTDLSSLRLTIPTISGSTEANSAGFTGHSDFLILQEINDCIVTTITELVSLVDSFVCNVTAISKTG